MTYRALVVDDDPDVLEVVGDILQSLVHEHDDATCQEEARRLLDRNSYSYYLLDLEIPVHANRGFPRIQNGENLLAEIAARRGPGREPIIVITGHGRDGPQLAVEMMKLGANDYITKPFATVGKTLDRAILDALARHNDGNGSPVEVRPAFTGPTAPFEGGELTFFPDRVELCGTTVIEGPIRIRGILEELRARRSNGKYVAFSGAKLAQRLGIVAGQNAIAEAVKDFRDEVIDALMTRGIACGRNGVILSGGCGYRLAEWIKVREAE